MKRLLATYALFGLLCGGSLAAPENAPREEVDSDFNWKIRREEAENSRLMHLVRQLTDVYGPRLTGSPNFKAACEWSMDQMKEWGMKNVRLEEWRFGHTGWVCEKYVVRVAVPYRTHVNARVVAWTPSTKGMVRAELAQIDPPANPTEEILATYLESVKDNIRGKIVLVGTHTVVPILFNPPVKRLETSELQERYKPRDPSSPDRPQPPKKRADTPEPMNRSKIDAQIDAALLASGALVKVIDAARTHGQIRVFGNSTYNTSKAIPSIVVQSEDYGRMSRLLADGKQVEMEVEIDNTVYSEEMNSVNVVAEIPGTDNKDQVVMLGAHIDSWHAGTGATDNATGVAAVMEAARILQKLELRPRRTIRVVLWGGEEQGLLGSKAYVKDHYGTFEAPKSEFSDLSAYINIDSGTGRARAATVFGPPEAAAVLRGILEPLRDLGFVGTEATNARAYGATDSTSFNWAGLPGIDLRQDPIEYFTHTWHTDLDTFERVAEEDLKQCAIVIASAVYHLAMREALLPRFDAESMPEQQSPVAGSQ